MTISPARRIAFDILQRVSAAGDFASDLLHAHLGDHLRREDAALATELTLGVLRWQRLLDFFLARHTRKSLDRLDPEVLLALRLALYQLRFLDRVPASAAVNESVELVKRTRKSSAASFVNAVLRHASPEARQPLEPFLPHDLPLHARLGILHSHPDSLVRRWLAHFGASRTRALLEANNAAPLLACALHTDPARPAGSRAEILESLRQAGLAVSPGHWLRDAILVHGGRVMRSAAFRAGQISIQDEASQMLPLLLAVQPGDSVLDLCAGQGGKFFTLARAAASNALVIAADWKLRNLKALRRRVRPSGMPEVCSVALDATSPLPFSARFQRILVDAPCSGTGTLARHPEIRWRFTDAELADFQRRQVALLSNAADHLAPGGRLLYATCSLEPEENEHVVAAFLRVRPDLRLVSARGSLAPFLLDSAPVGNLFPDDNFFRTFPPDHRTDGFFAAAFTRP